MSDKNKKSIHEKVLSVIKEGGIKMRPKWHFVLKAALASVGGVLLLLSLLYLISFVIFILHRNGVWFVPIFGLLGLHVFLFSLPWLLLFVGVIFVIILEILVRHYSFAYRRPMIYSVTCIIFLAIIGGFVVSKTRFHGSLMQRAKENRLSFGGPLYRQFGMQRFQNVHPGTITEISGNGFVITDRRDEKLLVAVTSETRFPFGMNLEEGDSVVVFGELNDGTIQALGIRKINDADFERRLRPRSPRHFMSLPWTR